MGEKPYHPYDDPSLHQSVEASNPDRPGEERVAFNEAIQHADAVTGQRIPKRMDEIPKWFQNPMRISAFISVLIFAVFMIYQVVRIAAELSASSTLNQAPNSAPTQVGAFATIHVIANTNLNEWFIKPGFRKSASGREMLTATIRYQGRAGAVEHVVCTMGNGRFQITRLTAKDAPVLGTSIGEPPANSMTLRISWEEHGRKFSGKEVFQLR